jgi:metallo-beta-lactamase family protein
VDATAEIAKIVLLDSAKLQEEDVKYKEKRHRKAGRKSPYPYVPLYKVEDAEKTIPHFSPVSYRNAVPVGDGVEATFHNVSHILGAATVQVRVKTKDGSRTIVFSGDVGRWGKPILKDPNPFEEADYILVESTYGDRLHEEQDSIDETLASVINTTVKAGGNILIPSFALERSQEVLYHLNQLRIGKRIPRLMVFLDSPMAISVTEVFKNHPELFDKEMKGLLRAGKSPFHFHGLKTTRTVEASKAINQIKGSVIVIAGSGMCTGGRIKHHLFNNIARKETAVLFVGYQAIGTLGRRIVDGAEEVRILGRNHPVRARVAQIHGFSAHADRDELFRFLSTLRKPPRHLFITHGEPESSLAFARFLKNKTGWKLSVPKYREEAALE